MEASVKTFKNEYLIDCEAENGKNKYFLTRIFQNKDNSCVCE